MNRVLIVEDEGAYQKILKESFEKAYFKVSLASDAKTALTELISNRPDIILLDIILPGGENGFDFLEKLKRNDNTKSIPVIVITNIASEEKVAKEIGASFYFIKSEISIEEIVKKVKQLLS